MLTLGLVWTKQPRTEFDIPNVTFNCFYKTECSMLSNVADRSMSVSEQTSF